MSESIEVEGYTFTVSNDQPGLLVEDDLIYATVIIEKSPCDIIGTVNKIKGLAFNVKIKIPVQLSGREVIVYSATVLKNSVE